MCGQVLKAVITMCIEINCDCVFGITGRRLLKRVSNTPLFRFSLPRCVRIFSHNGLSPSYLLTSRRALRCIKVSYICVYRRSVVPYNYRRKTAAKSKKGGVEPACPNDRPPSPAPVDAAAAPVRHGGSAKISLRKCRIPEASRQQS